MTWENGNIMKINRQEQDHSFFDKLSKLCVHEFHLVFIYITAPTNNLLSSPVEVRSRLPIFTPFINGGNIDVFRDSQKPHILR